MNNTAREPGWKRAFRRFYFGTFVVVLIELVAMLVITESIFRSGTSEPTPSKTQAMFNHGRVAYITAGQESLNELLFAVAFTAVPVVILAGLLIHFVLGIRLFERR